MTVLLTDRFWPNTGLADFIRELAQRNNVAYIQTEEDARGLALHKELGNTTVLDDTELLLIALSRAAVITKDQWLELHCAYMAELHSGKAIS